MNPPRLLVLRIWSEPDAYRAVVREPALDRTDSFDAHEGLCRFLQPAAAGADDAAQVAAADALPQPRR